MLDLANTVGSPFSDINLVATCDLVTIFQRPFFNLLHKIIRFRDIMRFSDSFAKSRLHCTYFLVNIKANLCMVVQAVCWFSPVYAIL